MTLASAWFRSCDRLCPPPAYADTTTGAAMLVHARTCPNRPPGRHRNGPLTGLWRAPAGAPHARFPRLYFCLRRPAQAPLTATTPLIVPSSTSGPDSDGEAKGASAPPRLILYRTCPVAGL